MSCDGGVNGHPLSFAKLSMTHCKSDRARELIEVSSWYEARSDKETDLHSSMERGNNFIYFTARKEETNNSDTRATSRIKGEGFSRRPLQLFVVLSTFT